MSFLILGLGLLLTIYSIARFTSHKDKSAEPVVIFGFTIKAEMVSLIYFMIGVALIVLFLIVKIQPLFYKGRDLQIDL